MHSRSFLLLSTVTALFLFSGIAAAQKSSTVHQPMGDCRCEDLAALVDREHEVEAAIAALQQEIAVVLGTAPRTGVPKYSDATDRHLLEDDLQKAMDTVHDAALSGRVKNSIFSSECDRSVQGPTACLNGAANAGEAAYLEYCTTQRDLNHKVAGVVLGNSNWQERRPLTLLLGKALDAYRAELEYIDQRLDSLKDVCQTKDWSGEVTVTYEEKYDNQINTPGTIRGTQTIANRDHREAVITVINGKAVGHLTAYTTSEQNETKSGQTSCHGGGITAKTEQFSSTAVSNVQKNGDFYSRPSFHISFDNSGMYHVSVAIKGGYGIGRSTYSYNYQGNCGKSTPETEKFLPKEFLDGISATGKARGSQNALVLHDSDTPTNTNSGGMSRVIKIGWNLKRSGAK